MVMSDRVPRFYSRFCIYLEEFEVIQGEDGSEVRRNFPRGSDAYLQKIFRGKIASLSVDIL